jgi:D-alanyl-D-alanine carboxypeptidase
MHRTASFFILFSFICSLSAQFPVALAQELQSILDERVNFGGDHGLAGSVILADGSEWHGQAGVDGSGNPITDSTVFHGASVLKTHVAACLMLLAEEGLVSLDDSWSNYVNLDVEFYPEITIRQLLSNTSGIADYLEIAGVGEIVTTDLNHFWAPEELLEEVVNQTPDFLPGFNFHYSSSNFVLAGLIIEAVSGNGLYEELRARIWQPLGLEHTYGGAYEEYAEPRAGVWWNFTGSYDNWSSLPETSMLSFAYGCSGIVSTPSDQVKFINALLGGNLVSDSSLEQMHDFSPFSFDDWSAGYGMGIHHAINVGEDQVIGVDGYYTNMSSTFRSETYGFSIATMTNSQTAWYGIFSPMYEAIKSYLATSIQENQYPSVLVYPQPASDILTIEGSFPLETQVSIFNSLGDLVQRLPTGTNGTVDVSQLSPGYYILELSMSTEERIAVRFCVHR